MKFEDIHKNWEEDGKIDQANMVVSSLDRFVLHNKYCKLFNAERAVLFRLKADRAMFYNFLYEYYTNHNSSSISNEELEKYGYNIRDEAAIPKVAVDKKIESDPKWIELNLKYSMQDQKCDFVEDILQTIRYRNKDIENTLNAIKMISG